MPAIRRDYKDSLFCHLFGEEHKDNALALYNALSGASLTDPGELTVTTIGNAVYLGRKNDVAYLVGSDMVLWEHQSTWNPNMPLRGLLYFARLYTKLIELNELDLYGETLLELPTPRYVVFYFGERTRPERQVLRLSESFTSGPGDVEVQALVLNCNEGNNKAIMDACESLRGYSHLLALDRRNRKEAGMTLQDAARAAVDQCIREGVLAGCLTRHRAEVEDMLFTIQDEERAMRVHWKAVEREAAARGEERGFARGEERGFARGEERGFARGEERGMEKGMEKGMERGMERGMEKGKFEALRGLVSDGLLDPTEAAARLGVSPERFAAMCAAETADA